MKENKGLLLKIIELFFSYHYVEPVMKFSRYLISSGVFLMASGGAWKLAIILDWVEVPVDFELSPSHPFYTGLILIIPGLALGLWRAINITKKLNAVLIDHRGMEGMNITNPKNTLPRNMRFGEISRINLCNNVNYASREKGDLSYNLQRLLSLSHHLESILNGHNNEDILIYYAGLAPIPFLFAAGQCLSSRQKVICLDYDRYNSEWYSLNSKGSKLELIIEDSIEGEQEYVNCIMGFSVPISLDSISDDMKDGDRVLFTIDNPVYDSLKNKDDQDKFISEIVEFFKRMKVQNPNINLIKMSIASQASFVFNLGRHWSLSVLPSIEVYNYDAKSHSHPWGIRFTQGNTPELIGIGLSNPDKSNK